MEHIFNPHADNSFSPKTGTYTTGVKSIGYPFIIGEGHSPLQHTAATIDMHVCLQRREQPPDMTICLELLNRYRPGIRVTDIRGLLTGIKEQCSADSAHITVGFSFFCEKEAPVTKASSLMEYRCRIRGSHVSRTELVTGVEVPVTTLCPCSRQISNYSAHNQKCMVTINLSSVADVGIEDIISIAEKNASSPLYPLLKRPDEKAVTEKAYDKPVSVETLVHDIAKELDSMPAVRWYAVTAENHESIHDHQVYASIQKHSTLPQHPHP